MQAYLVEFGTGAGNQRIFSTLNKAREFYPKIYNHLHQAYPNPKYPLPICAMRPLEDQFGNSQCFAVQPGTNVYNHPDDCHCGKLERFTITAVELDSNNLNTN